MKNNFYFEKFMKKREIKMITKLQKLTTRISIIQEIPTTFFDRIENSTFFGEHLFPNWVDSVFKTTDLYNKFEEVYNKYKSIKTKSNRDKIRVAFFHNNLIEELCNNQAGSSLIELNNLPKNIQNPIKELFLYLYNTAINYHKFEKHVSDSVKNSIDRFIKSNRLEVCPFCGLEGFSNLEGQSRTALDHWLCKESFPMASVNFDNLFPIGSKCNERPAKGSKNILIDNSKTKNRIKAYYPYLDHNCVAITFDFIKGPSIDGINNTDWKLINKPISSDEQDIFNSWDSIMNISIRYSDYYRKNIFHMWESDYKSFIEDAQIGHATNIEELKQKFKIWSAAFPIKKRPGAILYRAFIDYLINRASEGYLYSLCENFKR